MVGFWLNSARDVLPYGSVACSQAPYLSAIRVNIHILTAWAENGARLPIRAWKILWHKVGDTRGLAMSSGHFPAAPRSRKHSPERPRLRAVAPIQLSIPPESPTRFMARIDAFFKLMSEQKASDLHLSTSNPPMLRINGDLIRVDYPPLTNDELQSMVYEIAPEMKIKVFEETGDVDFGYEIPGVARYRANFLNQKYGIAAVFRLIPSKVLTCDDLGLPPVLKRFPLLKKGLVLVTGPTGSGKSTTLAAMIDYANLHRQDHIITVEDPIEFVHKSQQCLVNHREVGVHTKSFAAALRGALREDPDVILVGEMRDLETIELALTAAATGHLVFGTLHTSSAAKTVDRVIDVFPTSQQNQVRATLAESLKGVVAQNLFRRIDKPGRVAALEILVFDSAIANLVREGKTHQIPGMIQVGKKKGNQPLDDAIMDHLRSLRISPEEAYEKANDKKKFRPFLQQPPDDFED
jgi:twitching motility protein PilT